MFDFVQRLPVPGSVPTTGIKGANGDIFTGFYKNFQSLSDDEKQGILDERKQAPQHQPQEETR
jgi:hypothetical protein